MNQQRDPTPAQIAERCIEIQGQHPRRALGPSKRMRPMQ